MDNNNMSTLQTTIEKPLPDDLKELLNCVIFWNKEGQKYYELNCPAEKGRKTKTYEGRILDCMRADCQAIIKGRPDHLPYKFDRAGSHVWVSHLDNDRILMFHF